MNQLKNHKVLEFYRTLRCVVCLDFGSQRIEKARDYPTLKCEVFNSLNKKAQLGDQTMFIAFLFILLIIGVGIATGIFMFFGREYDFRELDAEILNRNLQKCFSEQKINLTLENEALAKELFEKCKLNEQVIAADYYINIIISEKEKLNFKDTNKCAFGNKNPEYPICANSSISINNENIFILSGTNQKAKIKAI